MEVRQLDIAIKERFFVNCRVNMYGTEEMVVQLCIVICMGSIGSYCLSQ
jgi:hypothetical protein